MEQGWQTISSLFGGLALFLYGMEQMSASLRELTGHKLKHLLYCLTATPLRGVLVGLLVTALMQSSSAVTVMLVGLVNAGMMRLRQAIPVLFGANIGTTVTAQLLSFEVTGLRYPILFAGLLLCFACAEGKAHNAGQALFGFGLLFEGITVIGQATGPLAEHPFFLQWMQRVDRHPVWGLAVGLAMTLIVQSSSATIAVLQDLASRPGPDGVHSLLGLQGSIPVLLGDNIGTTITAVLASLGGNRDTKRLAAAHALFNVSGALAVLVFLPQFTAAVQWLSSQGDGLASISRQIANAHTLFNLFCAVAWLPFTVPMERFVCWLIPDEKKA